MLALPSPHAPPDTRRVIAAYENRKSNMLVPCFIAAMVTGLLVLSVVRAGSLNIAALGVSATLGCLSLAMFTMQWYLPVRKFRRYIGCGHIVPIDNPMLILLHFSAQGLVTTVMAKESSRAEQTVIDLWLRHASIDDANAAMAQLQERLRYEQ